MYVCMNCMYVCMYCMYVCMCMYVCLYIFTHTHSHTHKHTHNIQPGRAARRSSAVGGANRFGHGLHPFTCMGI